MFYGREEDLSDLMALWRKSTASLVTCRGRRRIGKSTLVEEFARRSKARFVEIAGAAPRKGMTNEDQLKAFARQLSAYLPERTCPVLKDWSDAFRILNGAIGSGKTIVLLDEISTKSEVKSSPRSPKRSRHWRCRGMFPSGRRWFTTDTSRLP